MTLLIIAVAVYLLMGVALCIKGKLATKVAYTVAMTATFNKLPAGRVWLYLLMLRVGVVLGWPVLWIGS